MKIASIKTADIANGFGIGVSVWVTGCSLHCKGCFNPHLWDKDACGHEFCRNDVDKILNELKNPFINHLSILGGNPTEIYNIPYIIDLCKEVREVFRKQ